MNGRAFVSMLVVLGLCAHLVAGDCLPGTFVNNTAPGNCTACPTFNVSTTINATSCTFCGTNQFYVSPSQCSSCPGTALSTLPYPTNVCTCQDAGTIWNAATSTCTACTGNTIADGTHTSCTACPGNTIPDGTHSSCINCGAGSVPTSNHVSCQPCPAGTYSNAGDASCTSCAAGSFSSAPGSSTCSSCTSSSFNTASGSTTCTSCGTGQSSSPPYTSCSCNDAFLGMDCPGNDIGGSSFSSSSANACIAACKSTVGCIAAVTDGPTVNYCWLKSKCANPYANAARNVYYVVPVEAAPTSTATCTLCSGVNGIPSLDRSQCTPCSAGKFYDTNVKNCTACPYGSYSSATGVSTCSSCKAGTFANQTAQTICFQCGPGTVTGQLPFSSCTPCPVNTYATSDNSACMPCPYGTYAYAGNSNPSCTPCPLSGLVQYPCACNAGTYPDNTWRNGGQCSPCYPGAYCAGNGTNPTLCDVNTFQNGTGQSSCYSCPTGWGTPGIGASSVTQCSFIRAGYANVSGVVETCQPGYYSHHTNVKQCTPCPLGTYSNVSAMSSCYKCDMGFYTSAVGSSYCQSCGSAFTAGLDYCPGSSSTLSTTQIIILAVCLGGGCLLIAIVFVIFRIVRAKQGTANNTAKLSGTTTRQTQGNEMHSV